MPLTYTIDHAAHFMSVVAEGPITADELHRHLDAETADGALGYRELVDARGANPVWSSAETRGLVQRLREMSMRNELGATAVVVSTDFAFGMLRMLEILAEEICLVRPFRERGAAEAWLSAPSAD